MLANVREDNSDVVTFITVLSFIVDEERAVVIFDCYRCSLGRKFFSYDLDFVEHADIMYKSKKTRPPLEIPFVHLAGSKPFYTNTLFLPHGTQMVFGDPADRDRLLKLIEGMEPVRQVSFEPRAVPRTNANPMRRMKELWDFFESTFQHDSGLEMTCTSCKITGDSSMKVTFVVNLVHDANIQSESDEEEERVD